MSSDEPKSPLSCPASWRQVRLKDIATKIGSGATPAGGQAAYQEERSNYALVRSQNVFDRAFSGAGLAFISDDQAEGLRNVKLQANDLLLNITGDGVTFGRACIVPKDVLPACVNQHVSIIRLNPSLAHPGYVLSYLTHQAVKGYIEAFNAGGSRRAITKGHIESFVVPLPPMQVQNEIAETLGALDDRITLLRETNATLEAIAQALFKSWFVDFDPVHAKQQGRAPEGMDEATAALFPDSFEESELGLVPKGWGVRTLGEILALRNERTKPTEQTKSLPYVPIESISAKVPFLQEYKSGDEANSSLILFRDGDILFGAMRPYFHKVCIAPFDGVTRTTVFTLYAKNQNAFGFALWQAFQETTIEYATQHSEGSTIPYAKWSKSLELMPVIVPTESIQVAFSEVIASFVQRANSNVKQAQTLATLRDTLLPRLISGQLRLPEAEAAL